MTGSSDTNRKKSDKVFNEVVGKRIKDMRLSKRLTQTQVANAIGVTFQQIQKYERGTNQVSFKRMLDICQFMDIHYRYFCNCIMDDVKRCIAASNDSITTEVNDVERS